MKQGIDAALLHFDKLEEANAKALEELANVRTCFIAEAQQESGVNSILNATSYVREMFLSYYREEEALDCAHLYVFKELLAKVIKIEEDTIRAVESVEALTRLGGSVSLREKAMDTLYTRVERLSEAMQNPQCNKFKPDYAATLHDIIRYIHQKGVDTLFNFDDQPSHSKVARFSLGKHRIRILDLERVINKPKKHYNAGHIPSVRGAPLLRAMLEYYASSRAHSSRTSETLLIISTEDTIRSRFNMGSHYGELEAKITGDDSGAIRMTFRDTSSYRSSSARSAYVREVLRKLGFGVSAGSTLTKTLRVLTDDDNLATKGFSDKKKNKMNVTLATYEGHMEDCMHNLKEVSRLLNSTADLDLCDNMNLKGAVMLVADIFMGGTTNLYDFMSSSSFGKKLSEYTRSLEKTPGENRD